MERASDGTSLCQALALAACPIALLVSDLAAAERYAGMLIDHSTRYALPVWRAWGRITRLGMLISVRIK
jgi:hypothetical protein